MNGATEQALTRRIETLEAEVEAHRHALRRLENLRQSAPDVRRSQESDEVETARAASGPAVPKRSGSSPVRDQKPSDSGRSFGLPEGLLGLRSWEWWLNKVGVGLLLFGVAFLFKFSVDQGWLTPGVRVGIGLLIGAVLVGIGLRVYGERRAFSQVLLGGGIGTFYITGFAAFQLYGLVSYPVAVAFMVSVTLLAFTFSIRQNGMALALVGAAGGFGTPFVLYTDSGSLSGLVLYTCLVLAGVCGVYVYKGWRTLLLFSSVAVWTIFFIGYDNYIYFVNYFVEPGEVQGRLSLVLGVLFAWLVTWGVSVTWEILRHRDPDRWRFPEPGQVMRMLFAGDQYVFRSGAAAHLLSIASPLPALTLIGWTLDLQERSLGLVALGGALVYALASVALRRVGRDGGLFYTHALVALLLATLSLVLVLEGEALFFALALEATLLHLVSRRVSDRILSVAGHVLFLVVGVWLWDRLVLGAVESEFFPEDTVFFDVGTWLDLAVIVLALGVLSVLGFVTPERARWVYGIIAHAALLGWAWRELAVLPDSDAYISLAWGVYAVGLLVVGLRMDRAGITRLGLVTLFVVVGKLFLVDLAWVGAVWRILLFLGFGGLFLLLSYYLQSLWRPGENSGGMNGGATPGASG